MGLGEILASRSKDNPSRPLRIVNQIQRRLFEGLGSRRFVILAVVASAIGLSLFSIVRFIGLQTYAWDTGVYNQAIYTTLFQGKAFFYTADLPANPTGSLLGVHFSPILLAM